MRSRAARFALSATAWLGLIAAAVLFIAIENTRAGRHDALAAFEERARHAADTLASTRIAQQAYVAAGQDAGSWVPRVATLIQSASETVDTLRATTTTPDAGRALLEATSALTELRNVDKRAREYLRAGEPLMASDVLFTEGQESATQAAASVEAARAGEAQSLAVQEGVWRRWRTLAMAGAAGWAILVMGILTFAPAQPSRRNSDVAAHAAIDTDTDLPLHGEEQHAAAAPPPVAAERPAEGLGALAGIAELCTELSQVRDAADLQAFLGRAASRLDATGVVVWVGSSSGSDLRPIAAHGYGESVLAMLTPISRTADNAAAAAYRDGMLHVVRAAGGSAGAVVAPLMSIDGCIGALTAEIREGRETSPVVQAVAAIVAAQLAGVLAPAAPPQSSAHNRVASA
jgi:hypothetical protein